MDHPFALKAGQAVMIFFYGFTIEVIFAHLSVISPFALFRTRLEFAVEECLLRLKPFSAVILRIPQCGWQKTLVLRS
jgi:hypothetical protein